MRRLNIKLILGLVIGGLGLVVGMHLTRGYMLSRNSERLLDRAAVAKEEGDLKEQVRLMKRYVGFHPNEQEKRRELLDTWFKYVASDSEALRTEFGPYYNALKKALRDFPEDDELRRNAGYLTYQMGQPATSLEFIRELGTLNANDHVLWAQCDLQGGKKFGSINRSADGDVIDQSSLGAFERLGMVIGFDTEKKEFVGEPMPDAPLNAYRILADSYRVSEQDPVTAQKIVDHMVAVNPESAVAYVTRAQFTQMVGRGSSDALQASMADIQKGLELDPDNPRIAVFASDIQSRLGEVDKSLALLEQAVEKHPKNVTVLEALASVKSSLGEKEEALNLIQRAMEVSSLNPDLMFMRASINLDSGDVAAAKETLSRLRQTGAKPVQIGLLQARIQLAENNFVSASQTLERLNPAQNSQVRELLYRCYVRLGKTDKARELTAAAEASLNGSSSDASVIMNRARLAQDSGDLQSALRNYQELWEKHQNMLTPEGKETIFKQMLEIRLQLELAKDEKARDWSGVDKMAASWKSNPKLSRDDIESFEISIMYRKGMVREAMERVERAKMRNPNRPDYWILHNSMITDHEQAMKVLNLMQQKFGDVALVRRLKVERFFRIGTEDALAQTEQLLDGMDQFEKEDQQAIKRMAAEFNMRLKKFDRAIEIWQELKQANPTSLTLHAELLDLAVQAGNESLMTDTVNAIGELAGKDSSDWQLAEAQRIIWQVQNERRDASAIAEIKRLLTDVQRLRPDYPLLYKSLADLAILEKDTQAAFNALQTGLQKSTGNSRYVFLKQLGSLLTQMGRVQEGQHFLQQLPEEMRGRQDELTALVILAQRDPKAALQKARESISQDTTDVRELIMLAELYFVNEQYDQTAAVMKRATELDPKSPQAWQRRATMLVQMDRKDEVDALLPSIQASLEDPKKSLVLGQISAVLKRPDEAERWYQQALDGSPNDVTLLRNMAQFYLHREFNRTDKAWPILERMEQLDPSDALNAANSQWARQQSALLLAQSGTFEDFQKAIQKLEQNAKGGNLTGLDLQLWLQICAERPDATSRKMAADKLDEIALSRDLSTNEMMMRANLASQSGDWQQTRQMFMDLIGRNAKNEPIKASYCAQLIQHDSLSEAKRWLAQLTDGSPEKVQLQALIFAKENKAADARKLLVSFAQHVRKETPAALATVALAAEAAARNDAAATNGKMSPLWGLAEQLWQAFDKDNAESELELAGFYARVPQGKRLARALALAASELQNALKENDEAACMDYITVGITGLHNSREALGSNSKPFDEVEKWINACRAREIASEYNLDRKLSELLEAKQDKARLESLYKKLIQHPDASKLDQAIFRNNLAYMLAVSGRGQDALQVVEGAIDQLGPRGDLLDTRAMAYIAAGEHAKAVEDLQSIDNRGESTASTLFHLAYAQSQAADADSAKESLNRSIEMGLDSDSLPQEERQMLDSLVKQLGISLEKPSQG